VEAVVTQPIKLNGNVRLSVATMIEADLREAEKERADCITQLRKLDQRIATDRSILAVAGVETDTEITTEWK
jgi:hypothetical protein